VTLEKIVQDLIDILKIVAWPTLVIWIASQRRSQARCAEVDQIGPSGARFAPPAPGFY
jgi:hypothetical protein